MKVTEYILDIYHPDTQGSVWFSLTSDTPFQSIFVGDYISPDFYTGAPDFKSPGCGLRVTKLEHSTVRRDGETIAYKLKVFTEKAENPWG